MALSLMFTLSILLPANLKAQPVSINQQQQNININVPVIEKPVYIERYRTVYVNKPRVARKLDKPVLLLGYLWVYPEDLGNFRQVPVSVINSVNAQKPYGRDNWRIPTPDELAVLEANADRIGLGDDIYLATDHCNGVLRMVSTDAAKKPSVSSAIANGEVVSINGVLFRSRPINPQEVAPNGASYYYNNIPEGWRLPTEREIYSLMSKYDEETLFDKLRDCHATFNRFEYGYIGCSTSYTYIRILYTNALNKISEFEVSYRKVCSDEYYNYRTSEYNSYSEPVFILPVLDN